MTTTALSHINDLVSTTHQLNLLSSTSAAASNNDLTRNTSSPICSTSVVMLNSGCQPLQHYINVANQYSRPVPMLPPVTNIFEGVPIFLLSQSSSSSPVAGHNPYQRSITVRSKAFFYSNLLVLFSKKIIFYRSSNDLKHP